MKTALVSAALLSTSLIVGIASAQAPRPAPPTAQPPAARPPAATPPPTASPATPATATEPTLPNIDDPMLAPAPAAPQVLTSWRQAIDLVRRRSTNLRTSLARVDEAAGRARQALAVALPKLTARAGLTSSLVRVRTDDPRTPTPERVLLPDPATTWDASLNLRIPVFAPAAWHGHGTASDAIDAARLDVKEIERQVVAGVADAIVSAVTSERLAEVSRVSLASALSTLDLNKRRAALGASSMLDVLRVEQEVQLARAQLVSSDEGLLQAREALGLALGSAQGFGVTPDIRLDALADDARTVCQPERDVARRADVLAANAQVNLAERRRDGVSWSFWPTVDAVSDAVYFSEPQIVADGPRVAWTVGGELTWLLYDGGDRYGKKEELEATTRVAREQLSDISRRARLEVIRATRAVRVATANLGVSTRAREIAAETSRLAKVAFMNGSGTSFDLVDTARRLREAELDLAIKEFDLLRARVAALLALASCKV